MRFCTCGHVKGIHWGGDKVEEEFVGHPLPYRCHAKVENFTRECTCTKFRLRRNPLRRLIPKAN